MNFERQLELNQLMHVYHFALRTISKDLKIIEVATDRFDVWIDEIEKFLAKVPPEIEGELDAHRPQEGPPLLEACSQLSGCCRTHIQSIRYGRSVLKEPEGNPAISGEV